MKTAAVAAPAVSPAFAKLQQIAAKSLANNIHEIGGKSYASAGAQQFKGLWTRDFAWSARGLIAMGRPEVVKDQLELLLKNMRPSDGLLPRSLDSTDTKFRVALATAHQLLPFIPESLGIGKGLKPEYIDQHGQLAFDGNMMAVLAAKQYVAATGDTGFWNAHKAEFAKALSFYDDKLQGGLLVQPPFSDWQDSVKREGKSFYSNMVYAKVLEDVAGDPAFPGAAEKAAALRTKIDATFKDPSTGLYKSMATGPQTSLDGNLLALDLGYVDPKSAQGKQLYESLKKSPLWSQKNGPGFTTWPPYPEDQKASMVKFVGIGAYHDKLYWSWEMALAAKVAGKMGDTSEAKAIVGRLETMASRDGNIGEIYDPNSLKPKQTLLYKSEQPFTWGSAFVVDAMKSLESTVGRG